MKKCYTILLAALSICCYQVSNAQVLSPCSGVKGPNALGAKGTFSAPYITVNTGGSDCISVGTNSYSPAGNLGNGLMGCINPGILTPCSDYVYTDLVGGLSPAFRYSILKTIGNNTWGNCIKTERDWKGRDHTGDGGYFMVVNGAPADSYSPLFYQIKNIPVCKGAIYEFSAWVINLLPAASASAKPGSEPNISFKVNGNVIVNSGPIAYSDNPAWVKVAGSFVVDKDFVDLEVINATSSYLGNDLGLDDISFNVCESKIAVDGPLSSTICNGTNVSITYTVTDDNKLHNWYKWQVSKDGGVTFKDSIVGAQAAFVDNAYMLTLNLGAVNSSMNGYKYRLGVSTSLSGLTTPECVYFNDYSVFVGGCVLPVQLSSFNGRYSDGKASLEWQTSQEINVDHFELFRSTDGIDFIKVSNIKSAGNSNTIKNYNYLDNINGTTGNSVYYRIKQIDIDGKATFSSVVKLSLGSKLTFDIFPNPFTTNFTISFGAIKTSTAIIKIRNSAGNQVYAKTINVVKGNNSVVMNHLPTLGSGVYYVTVYNDELNFNGKLQKQ